MDSNEGIGKYLIPAGVLIAAVVIVAAFAFGRGMLPEPVAAAVDIAEVDTDGALIVGSPEAPIAMAVWFDYQCPHCQRFEADTMPQVYANYVDTGKIRVVYKDFQFLGADSDAAALMARAVYERHPDLFRAWLDAVMAAHAADEGFGGIADLEAATRAIPGMDADAVLALITEKRGEYQRAIAADRAEGASFGITGTPAVIIGTTLLAGAYPYAQVAALLDASLGAE